MVTTYSKLSLSGLIIILCAGSLMIVEAQTTSDTDPLPRRLVNLLREIPKEVQPPAPDSRLKALRPGLFGDGRKVFEIASADGKTAAGTVDGALYLRLIDSEAKNIIAKPVGDWRWDVEGALWSPDGRIIAARMIDEHDVPSVPIVNWLGKHEEVFMNPYSRAGEKIARHQLYIVEVASGKAIPVQHGENDPYFHILDWDSNSRALYFLRSDRLTRRLDLLAANAEDGRVKLIFTETNKFGALWWNMLQGYDEQMTLANQVRMLENGNFIWTSERNGFEHLYLYDRNGQLIRALTEGKKAGFVQSLIDVDDKRGYAYVIMQDAGSELYDQTLYRFRLADGQPQKLAEGPTLRATISKDKDKLWISRTGLPNILEVEELSSDGSNRKIIWSPDISFLKESGFPPEIIKTMAADGKTELRTLIFKPKDFDPKKSYPVIENIYAGPNTNVIVNSSSNVRHLRWQEIANRGFIIIWTDGRGTLERGQAFQNYAAGRWGQVEIADHAAVIRQLGKTRSYMDLARVGITGQSWGGYFAFRALLQEPELYKVGVLTSPSIDVSSMRVAVESFMGCLPVDCPAAYKAGDNMSEINKLKAPVLIIIGTADNDVPNAETFKLVGALQRARKEHEVMVLPGLFHNVMASPVTLPKLADFFERHLAKSPENKVN